MPTPPLLFEASPLENAIVDLLIPRCVKPGRFAAMTAIWHLNRAWKIREIDPEMAAFRCISAAEESATALFHALKNRGYAGANKLRLRDHVHKNAVVPFVEAVGRAIHELSPVKTFTLQVDKTAEEPRLLASFELDVPGLGTHTITPDPPLHFSLKQNELPYDFAREFQAITAQRNVDTMTTLLETRADMRNHLLYASNEGVQRLAQPIVPLFETFRGVVFRTLIIYLMIDPYRERQLFVQQCLDAFLRMVNALPSQVAERFVEGV